MPEQAIHLPDGEWRNGSLKTSRPSVAEHYRTLHEQQEERERQRLLTVSFRRNFKTLVPWHQQFVRDNGLVDLNFEELRQTVEGWEEQRRSIQWNIARVVCCIVEVHTSLGGQANTVYALPWGNYGRSTLVELAAFARCWPRDYERHDLPKRWYRAVYALAKLDVNIGHPSSYDQWQQLSVACCKLAEEHWSTPAHVLEKLLLERKLHAIDRSNLLSVNTDAIGMAQSLELVIERDARGQMYMLDQSGQRHPLKWNHVLHEANLGEGRYRIRIEPHADGKPLQQTGIFDGGFVSN